MTPDPRRPRAMYLGRSAQRIGSVLGRIARAWLIETEDRGPRPTITPVWRPSDAGLQIASFVQHYVGGHISRRLRALSKIYLQYAYAPGTSQAAATRLRGLSEQSEQLAGTFPTWGRFAGSAIPVIAFGLSVAGALAAGKVVSVILTVLLFGFFIYWVVLLLAAFESFRLKRELLCDGARMKERRQETSPPPPGERNAYLSEMSLFRLLGRPHPKELAVDYVVIAALTSVIPMVFAVDWLDKNWHEFTEPSGDKKATTDEAIKRALDVDIWLQAWPLVLAMGIVVSAVMAMRRKQARRHWR